MASLGGTGAPDGDVARKLDQLESDYVEEFPPEPHPNAWMVYAMLTDAERSDQGLTPFSELSASELKSFNASKKELQTLEGLISAGGHQEYYTWLRTKMLRASQVEAVLRLLEHARKLDVATNLPAIVSAPTGWGKSVGIITAALPLVEAVVPKHLRQLRGDEPFRVLILVPSLVIRQQLALKIDTMFRNAPGRMDGDLLELVLPSQVPTKDARPYLCSNYLQGKEGGPGKEPSERLRRARIVVTNYHKLGKKEDKGRRGAEGEADFLDRLRCFPPNFFGLLQVDESHHVFSTSHRAVLDHFSGALRFFWSATPYSHRDRDLVEVRSALSITRDYAIKRRMIRRGLIYEYRYDDYELRQGGTTVNIKRPEQEIIDLCSSDAKFRQSLVETEGVMRDGIEAMLKHLTLARSKAGVKYGFIVRADSILHAENVCNMINRTSWAVGSRVTGESKFPRAKVLATMRYTRNRETGDYDEVPIPGTEQDAVMAEFEQLKLDVVVLVDKWKEGYDHSRIIGLLYLSSGQVPRDLVQYSGRADRPTRPDGRTWPEYVGQAKADFPPGSLELNLSPAHSGGRLTTHELPEDMLWESDKRGIVIVPRPLCFPSQLADLDINPPVADISELLEAHERRVERQAHKEGHAQEQAKRNSSCTASGSNGMAGGSGREKKAKVLKMVFEVSGTNGAPEWVMSLINGGPAGSADKASMDSDNAMVRSIQAQIGDFASVEAVQRGRSNKRKQRSAPISTNKTWAEVLQRKKEAKQLTKVVFEMMNTISRENTEEEEEDADAAGPSTRK